MTTPSDKSFTTEQRLNQIMQNGYPWPSIVFNSSDHTGVNGTKQSIGTVSTGVDFPTLQTGQSYQIDAQVHLVPTASGNTNVYAVNIDWTGSGAATLYNWSSQHFETGGLDIDGTNTDFTTATKPLKNNGSTSFGMTNVMPLASFGPAMHAGGNEYTSIVQGFIYNVTTPDTIQLTITSVVATVKVFGGCYVKITPVNFAP